MYPPDVIKASSRDRYAIVGGRGEVEGFTVRLVYVRSRFGRALCVKRVLSCTVLSSGAKRGGRRRGRGARGGLLLVFLGRSSRGGGRDYESVKSVESVRQRVVSGP